MKKQDHLYFLIHSMTQSEKRYFIRFSQSHKSKNNAVILFQFIDKQKVANDVEIKAHFKSHDFTNQLHVAKNYLFKLILKSLRQFQADYQVDYQIKNLLIEIDILIKKDLNDAAQILIQKTKELCNRYEKDHLLIELISKERRLILATIGSTKAQDSVNKLIEQEKICIERIAHVNEYWHKTINLYDRLNQIDATTTDEKIDESYRIDAEPTTVQGKSLFYYLKQSYSYLDKQPEKGIKYVDKMIQLWEDNPHRIQEDPSSYVTALNNRIVIAMRTNHKEDIPKLLTKIRQVSVIYQIRHQSSFAVKSMLQTYNIELELYRDAHEWERGINLIHEVEALIQTNPKLIPEDYRMLFLFQYAYLYYRNNNLDQALYYLNDLLRYSYSPYRNDIQSYGQFLNLIIHFELGHFVLLKYAVESCRRFLKKRQSIQVFERELLRFFSRISMNTDRKQGYLAELKKSIFVDMQEKEIDNVVDYIDFYDFINRHQIKNIN